MNQQFLVPQGKKSPNPLFLVLAILSGFPTAFFLLLFVTGSQSVFTSFGVLWSAMWTYVWWKMADRYR